MKKIQLIEMEPETFRELMSEVVREGLNGVSKNEVPRLPKYLTRSQAAEVLGVHVNTISLWEKSGKLKKDKKKGLECYLTTKILQILEERRDLGY